MQPALAFESTPPSARARDNKKNGERRSYGDAANRASQEPAEDGYKESDRKMVRGGPFISVRTPASQVKADGSSARNSFHLKSLTFSGPRPASPTTCEDRSAPWHRTGHSASLRICHTGSEVERLLLGG